MTISDTDKIDFLWKKVIYGVTTTANATIKSGANESIASPYAIASGNIWSDASLIPAIPPSVTTAQVAPHIGSHRIRATSDNTSPPYRTWFATASYNDVTTTLKTFIPPIYGPGYIAEVFVGDPSSGPAARIFPDAQNEEYVFDYSAGVLTFVNNIPAAKTATIGSGTVTVQSNGIYILAYQYVGATGGSGGGGIGDYVSKMGDTMSGPLIFSMTNEVDGKTILFSANPTANSYAGIGTLNTGETRFFANSSSVLSLGHISTTDGETYTADLSIGPDGVVTIGSNADGVLSVEDGYRIVLGHISNSNALTENFVIESNGIAYSNGYEVLTSGSNTGVLSGYSSTFTPLATGTYLSANIVVDNTGRIISASNGSGGGGGGGGVSEVDLVGSSSISVTGTPITTAGTFTIDLTTTGVSAGTYEKVTVDAQGRVTAGRQLANTDITTALGFTPGTGTVTSVNASSTTLNILGGPVTSTGTLAINLNTIGSAGTYEKVVTDAYGRITSGSNLNNSDITTALGYTPGTGNGTVTSVNASSTTLNISGGPVTSTGTLVINLNTVGSAGTYAKVVTDAYGRITSGSALSSSDITNALGYTPSTGNGTVTSVTTVGSADIAVGGSSSITSSGTFSLSLTNTTVIPGVYNYASITVDSKGRITAASNNTAGAGTVQSVNIAAGSGAISVSGSPITTVGTITVDLTNTGVSAGTYTLSTIVVDAKGRITSANSGTSSGSGTVTSVSAVGGSSAITISGSPITSSGTLHIDLSNTGIIAGTYERVTVDAQGRITAGANLASSDITTALGFTPGVGTVTSVNASSTTLNISGGPVTSSGTLAINLNTVGTAGTYEKVVTDAYGRITSGSALSNTDITSALGFTPLQHNEVITATGPDITGSGTTSIDFELSNTGVSAGHYTVASFTVDSKGRITSASSGTSGGGGTVTSVAAVGGSSAITVSGSPITAAGTLSIDLSNTGVTAGTYEKVTVDAQGRITAGAPLANTDITAALGFTPGVGTVTSVAAASTTLNITGSPVTSSGTLAINLNTVGSAGTYEKVVTDAYGRITSGSLLNNSDITTALGFTPIANNQVITVTGDVTGSGSNAITLTLNNVGTAGTYEKVVVNAKGLVTSGSNLNNSDITAALGYVPGTGNGTVTSVNASSTTLSISGGPVTSSGTLAINLNTTGTAGTYEKVVTDAYGRVTSGSLLNNSDITTALGFTPLQHNENISISGDITGSGSSAISTSLSTTGVTAGTYTLSTIVVDSKGRITNANSGTSGGVTNVSTSNSANIVSVANTSISSSGTLEFDLSNTGVTPGTYNYSTIVVDAKGRITSASTNSSSGGATFGVNKGNTSVVSAATTLNFTGNGVTVTDQGSGIAQVNVQDRVEYAFFQYGSGGSGNFTTGDNLISNSANMAVTITDATNCVVKFTFTGYTNPPIGIAVYGQNYATNQFTYNAVNGSYASGAPRVVTGGGTASSPTFTTSFTDITLSMKMGDTGASASVGQRSHAYIVFKF